MRRLTEEYKSRGIVVLAINVLDQQEVVQKFVAEHGPFASDILLTLSDESVVRAFGVEQFPSTIIVDGTGRIVATFSGGDPSDDAGIEAALKRLAPAPAVRRKSR